MDIWRRSFSWAIRPTLLRFGGASEPVLTSGGDDCFSAWLMGHFESVDGPAPLDTLPFDDAMMAPLDDVG